MNKKKSPVRLMIEEFLADKSPDRKDYLEIPCPEMYDMHRFRSLAGMMKTKGYPVGVMMYDNKTKMLLMVRDEVTA